MTTLLALDPSAMVGWGLSMAAAKWIVNDAPGFNAAWSADGSRIAASRTREIAKSAHGDETGRQRPRSKPRRCRTGWGVSAVLTIRAVSFMPRPVVLECCGCMIGNDRILGGIDSMNQHLSQAEEWLRSLLHGGPRNSREVLASMMEREFSPKQVRRARERQGVLIERAGSGSAMHSVWRLPACIPEGASAAGDAPCTVDAPEMHHSGPAPNDGEHRRHRDRIGAFIAGGLDALTACELADKLVARDRAGLRASGSCAECQNLALRECPVAPRPVIEIHGCWYRRQCTP